MWLQCDCKIFFHLDSAGLFSSHSLLSERVPCSSCLIFCTSFLVSLCLGLLCFSFFFSLALLCSFHSDFFYPALSLLSLFPALTAQFFHFSHFLATVQKTIKWKGKWKDDWYSCTDACLLYMLTSAHRQHFNRMHLGNFVIHLFIVAPAKSSSAFPATHVLYFKRLAWKSALKCLHLL